MKVRDFNHEFYLAGDHCYQQRRFLEASKYFKQALSEWPEDWQALWALGNCYSELRKPHKAKECFVAALALSPDKSKPELYFNLGNACFDLQKFAEAYAAYSCIPIGHFLHDQVFRSMKLINTKISH